jgi:hypothetical protein
MISHESLRSEGSLRAGASPSSLSWVADGSAQPVGSQCPAQCERFWHGLSAWAAPKFLRFAYTEP